ncbi:hypothetical protein Y032_0037g3415 [Ancylostoma ceylanicum]|uniref:Uncharacterized protein n=1 Tax=Ancylostoma ceylanicum TaxID=53326 RepID=A0A016UK73_9BILA|nr:hypothetical protein Y032_0037g3415 [Ancylostoma ceylanicum]
MTTKTIHGNSQFQKPTSLRWTWESPGAEYYNEIDHIIVNRRFCLTDVEDTVVDNIDEEYEQLIQHLRDSAKKAEGSRITNRRLSHDTLELIRQHEAARAAGNYQLTFELARRCREAIKEDLKERRAAVLAEAAEAGRSIRNTR